jgi:hypothetical protein
MEAYTWVVRQVGKRGAWEPYQLANLPYPPTIDDKVTMQRFASSACRTGDSHKASFVLDFDAHSDWLHPDLCRIEVLRFLHAWHARWGSPPEQLYIAFSGRSGFHVTIPATLLGDIASPYLTWAYSQWATSLKDTLGLITLDAPSRQSPEWWWPIIKQAIGYLPRAIEDKDAFALSLRRVGIYTRRRMVRREGSQHPRSGMFKIPVFPRELEQGMGPILALARDPRERPPSLAPATHTGLQTLLQETLAQIQAQKERAKASSESSAGDRGCLPDVPLPQDAGAPLCVQRILSRPAPEGSSNMSLITLLSYWRATGIRENEAIRSASGWLLGGMTNPDKREERLDSAHSVGHAVYEHNYRFARTFIAPLRLTTDEECARCPLRSPCWKGVNASSRYSASDVQR